MRKYLLFGFVLLVGLLLTSTVKATHLRAGEIIVKRVNCDGLTFEITIIVYTDVGPANPVLFGAGELRFGDENDPDKFFRLPSDIPSNTHMFYAADGSTSSIPFNEDLGPDVAKAAFTIRHTYGSAGKYTISYNESNRNAGILNIENGNSINTRFYVQSEINIDGFLGCNNSPVLLIPPIDRACPGVAFFHNPGAFDPDGDSISFELVVPKKAVGTSVANYISPADRMFYENFSTGSEDGLNEPTFSINPVSGEIKWDAPGKIGEYNIAFIVREYRFKAGEWFPIGFVTRDMQIIVEDCDNERPELIIPEDICVEAGESINEIIFGSDPDNDKVKIEAFSQVIDERGAKVIPKEPIFSASPAQLQFSWDTECFDVRDQPYTVVFKITDQPELGPKLVSFASWNITVVGPKPNITSIAKEGQGLRLNWDSYLCDNAENIQVWRRVDSNPYTPDECETGIRENAGYSLIATLPVNSTTFRDSNLAAAAKYCYRLVATFPEVPGGESIVSDEICFEFVPAEEPIITHVSVQVTSETNGNILVAWREPFELGGLTFPLQYKIYRAEGFTGGNLVQVGSKTSTSSTTTSIEFTDTGLNTLNKIYHYQVALIDPSGNGTDQIFSAAASSVRLETTPQFGQIKLDWSAVVPWSNTIAFPPGSQHEIYRGVEGEAQGNFQLISQLDVTQYGFSYIDSIGLEDDKVYCYRVQTKGTYGNPSINSPQLNFSQVVCSQTSDSIPPCIPNVILEEVDCSGRCQNIGNNDYSNTISWTRAVEGECQNDIFYYELYFASTTDQPMQLIAEVRDTVFVHENLTSQKGCYQVRAVDRSGNFGELSEKTCIDNCPYYELPNVFTPDNNDSCNDIFRAYGSGASGGCGNEDGSKCARSVNSVDFTVYNRWGNVVYSYFGQQGTENNDIYINWNGNDNKGKELASGVYYYIAVVTFDVVDPANAKQNIKGWVHLIR